MLPKLYTGTEVAAFLHCSRGLAYKLMQADIPTIRFSQKTVRVKEEDLLRWIETHANNKQETFPGNNGGSNE